MKSWLSYTFEQPTDDIREYAPNIPIYEPCFYRWQPSIFCEDVSKQEGVYYKDTPFPNANICEIHVESIRAYHLLCRHDWAKGWEGTVRILPPQPGSIERNDKTLNIAAFGNDENEMILAARSVSRLGGCSAMLPSELMLEMLNGSRLALFPNKEQDTSLFLCAAITAGCFIVASDAGASEEYLSQFARPGTWHVVHKHSQSTYCQAARHLLGMESTANQSMYVDESPYE